MILSAVILLAIGVAAWHVASVLGACDKDDDRWG